MKNKSLRLICSLVLLFSVLPAAAQGVVPFVAKSLSKEAASGVLASAASKTALAGAGTQALLLVRPNMPVVYPFKNYSFFQVPEGLSTEEKNLWTAPKSEGAQLGLAALLYDQNAVLFGALGEKGGAAVSQAEFNAHQQAIAQAVDNMQQQLTINTSFVLRSPNGSMRNGWEKVLQQVDCGADRFTVQRLFDGEPQPLFPVITKEEMATFAALPSLQIQRTFIDDSLSVARAQLARILSQDAASLSEETLATYYLQKVRMNYFMQVKSLLANATEKRSSLIVRRRFSPAEGQPLMTDAQRLGYAYFTADTTPAAGALQNGVSLQAQAALAEDLYGKYATAEVFEIPYEKMFHIGNTSLLLLPSAEQTALEKITAPVQLEVIFTDRMVQTEEALQAMRTQKPDGAEFYAQYYRLIALNRIYAAQVRYLAAYR